MRWITPRRYSLASILVLMTVFSLLLAYRLAPVRAAQEFVDLANSKSPRAALSLLPRQQNKELTDYLASMNYPSWKAVIDNSDWEVVTSGRCRIVVEFTFASTFRAGVDEMSMTFSNDSPPSYEIQTSSRSVVTVTL